MAGGYGSQDDLSSATKSLQRSTGWLPVRPAELAPALALLSCILYSCNGELLQALQQSSDATQGHISPLLNLLLCHLGGLAFAPVVLWSEARPRSYPSPMVKGSALLFAFILMGYNYAFLSSSKFLLVGITNAVFQASTALVYLASVWLFREPLTLARVIGVALCLCGSAVASRSSEAHADGSTLAQMTSGIALAALAAVGVTVYQVLFRHWHGHLKYDVRFLMEFGMWVSIYHIIVMFPLVLLANFTGVEELHFPSGTKACLGVAASAAIASTVNGLYLCIVMWGSPMLLPCASAFSLPLMVSLDVVLHGARPAGSEVLGHLMVVASVPLILNIFSSNQAPAGSTESQEIAPGCGCAWSSRA
mmetsp:Transcript_68483/g.164464  ORF Transcript_68483/g.164464 Transcript_68483/m.164464 type:complete len:363 (-) Transcript_68483:129-1217(-)